MNDLRETRDDDIRDLLARARSEAPAPLPWHEVVERGDRSLHRPRWALLGVAAAVVAVGTVGLVVALQARGDTDDTPADQPIVGTIAPTVAGTDPLAGLGDDDWAVPRGLLPDGYEVLVATRSENGRSLGVVVGGDAVDEVHVSVAGGSVPEVTGDREVHWIDGVEWDVRVATTDDGAVLGHLLMRDANRHSVQVTTRAGLETAVAVAGALRPVPEADLDVAVLSDDGPFTTVVTGDLATMSVRGTNGFFCWRLDAGDVSSSGCAGYTEPDSPVTLLGGVGGPTGSFAVGLAEPDVGRIEFVRPDGELIVVEPVDESGRFEQRFWISDDPALSTSAAVERATVIYDDGSSAVVEPARYGAGWEIAERGDIGDVGDPLTGLGDGDWVLPARLPGGFEVLAVLLADGERVPSPVLIGGDGLVDVQVIVLDRRIDGDFETVTIDGQSWELIEHIGDDGVGVGQTLQREVNDRAVVVTTAGDLDLAVEIAAALRPVDPGDADVPVLTEDGPYVAVARLGDVSVEAHGINGVYCLRIVQADDTTTGACGARASADAPFADTIRGNGDGGWTAIGIATGDVERIEFLGGGDGPVVVEPTDESGTFGERFWISNDPALGVDSTIDRAEVTNDDGTTAALERTGPPSEWVLSDG